MIRWPSDAKLGDGLRRDLLRFRRTGAAAELEADAHVWELDWSSWNADYPVRLVWRDEKGRELGVVIEESGLWRLEHPNADNFP